MKLDRLYPRLSFLLVFTAIVAHCMAQEELLLVLVAGALTVASRSVCEGPRGRVLPRPWSLFLTCVALLWAVLSIVREPGAAIQCIGTFVVWLTLIKVYERRSIEHEAERLILSLLLMVLAALSRLISSSDCCSLRGRRSPSPCCCSSSCTTARNWCGCSWGRWWTRPRRWICPDGP